MSCLTSILQLLQVLTTITGCNIYKYIPQKQTFRLSSQLNLAVGVFHGFWLRPWLLTILLLYSIFFILEFIDVLVNLKPGSDNALNLLYMATRFFISNNTIFISYSIAYSYIYQRKQMRDLLNRFVRIYYRYRSIRGQGPKINWGLFLIHIMKMVSITTRGSLLGMIPFTSSNSILCTYLRSSGYLFGCIQPFFLGLTAHLGLLILYSCYKLPTSRPNRQQLIQMIDYYKNLIKLRRKLESLVRPLIWICMMDDFIFFVSCLHLYLFEKRVLGRYLYALVLAFAYPLSLVYINLAIDSAQREFGKFRANFKPERQLQMFSLYRLALQNGKDKSELNVFRINRGHILQVLSTGWTWAMFSKSIYVNSTEYLKHNQKLKDSS
ncbi:LOW QUALITY PROTEIN: uncharacterized protein LOC111078607 [Drosophila obscura]|uniref:LOW QUALITY PROTEIN: uncharacterized protein LOC111078607 n=1 Tax=Drosophila obscura TaxID=7282 RepID=UPI001BB16CA1|nr:LOW QUALITY PROTEIN: uncharacterized protein LOC111078607 [Drosophila obscura]